MHATHSLLLAAAASLPSHLVRCRVVSCYVVLCCVQRPSALVSELDRFIVGQSEAKRAVAVALRKQPPHTAKQHWWEPALLPSTAQSTMYVLPPSPIRSVHSGRCAGCALLVQATGGVAIV